MERATNEFSFALGVSQVQGIGVFALHPIAAGTKLALLPDGCRSRVLRPEQVPEPLRHHCVEAADGTIRCPNAFNHMHVAWHLNHSNEPNARHEDRDNMYYALRDIAAGEEITIDYRSIVDDPNWSAEYVR